MTSTDFDPGSFRDPRGQVLIAGDRIFRRINPIGVADFRAVRESGVIRKLINRGWLINETEITAADAGLGALPDGCALIEHPRLSFVSYPYEWTFSGLRDAALRHLEIQRACLAEGVMLNDASAYNIQFENGQPLFIDSLSFRPYRDGEPWTAHQQFCDQFLNPLLLASKVGVAFNAAYRGHLDGIPTDELARMLPLSSRFSMTLLQHVFALSALNARSAGKRQQSSAAAKRVKISREALDHILGSLHGYIAALEPAARISIGSQWRDYRETKSYAEPENADKRAFIEKQLKDWNAGSVIDLGCNTGEFSFATMDRGVARVIGVESDPGAADAAYAQARARAGDFLPLVVDLADPSPAQGWRHRERQSLSDRLKADGVLALALVHHLAIGRNLPLDGVLQWVVNRAPRGVIEFVPRADPRVQDLLRLREDLFDDYNEPSFRDRLGAIARIVDQQTVSASGRTLYAFHRD